MVDSSPEPDETLDPDHGEGMPRWVEVFAVVGALLLLVVIVVLVSGGHEGHGPGRHLPEGDASQVGVPQNAQRSGVPGRG